MTPPALALAPKAGYMLYTSTAVNILVQMPLYLVLCQHWTELKARAKPIGNGTGVQSHAQRTTSTIVRLRGWVGAPTLKALEAGPRQREAEQRHAHLGPQHSSQPREATAAALPLQPEPLEHLVPRGDGVSGKW